MDDLLNAGQMKAADEYTIREIGIPSEVLMERAALAVVEEIHAASFDLSRVLIVCGSGNNGGDGFAVARLLSRETKVTLAFVGKDSSMSESCALQKKICLNCGLSLTENFMEKDYTLIVDAMLGIGLTRNITGRYAEITGWINEQNASVVAVDIPSGVSADDGKIMGNAVHADLTVTFSKRKIGQILYPGASFCGTLICRDIGVIFKPGNDSRVFTYDRTDLARLPKRLPYSNKGTYGKVLLVAGSEGMCGAAVLSACAALKSGCGMVRVLTPLSNRIVLQTALPEAIVTTYDPSSIDAEIFYRSASWADVVGIGPGLGTSKTAHDLLDAALCASEIPMVLDADALNLLSSDPALMQKVRPGTILTPHIGEMARLLGRKRENISDALIDTAVGFARGHQVVLTLKDARSVVSDGDQIYINTSGNDGMATAGSGDVLTGMICSLLAQGMDGFDAASFGVYLHGCAGDLARDRYTARAMTAKDIAEQIGDAAALGEEKYE